MGILPVALLTSALLIHDKLKYYLFSADVWYAAIQSMPVCIWDDVHTRTHIHTLSLLQCFYFRRQRHNGRLQGPIAETNPPDLGKTKNILIIV